jgi:competence protein ComEA
MKLLLLLAVFSLSFLGAVDINTAGKKELTSLNGIGAKKAEAIIAYRDNNCFKSVDELTKVKGIGKKIIDKNTDNLEASACK